MIDYSQVMPLLMHYATNIHGDTKTRSYLHRFKIIESPECPCGNGTQTVEHLLYECGKLNNEIGKLIANVTKEDHWPVRKSVLVTNT